MVFSYGSVVLFNVSKRSEQVRKSTIFFEPASWAAHQAQFMVNVANFMSSKEDRSMPSQILEPDPPNLQKLQRRKDGVNVINRVLCFDLFPLQITSYW